MHGHLAGHVERGDCSTALAFVATALKASQEGLALPLYSHMTDAQLEMVCRQVENLLE